MAGVKGRSGGPRKNAGGARPNAGRKPKAKPEEGAALLVGLEPQAHGGALKRQKAEPVPQGDKDMLQLLQDIALGRTEATSLQVRAAIAAVQYTHTKKGDGGKKEEQAEKAKRAGQGRFAPAAAPRLAAANGKKV